MYRFSRIVLLMSGMVVLSTGIGCTTFHMPFASKKFPKATAADPAAEILCLWTPGEGTDPDDRPCKGFMGQIMFLSRSSSRSVEVEGDVHIYLFDDQGTPEEQAKPLRIFRFDHGSWKIHLTDSSFGPAYRVFVPYVRRGTTYANCSLRVRLIPKQGPPAWSDFTNIPLNGYKKTLRGDDAKPLNQSEIDKTAAEAMSTELRRTTTISLSPTPKVPDAKDLVKIDPNSGQIQLANFETETDTGKKTVDAERIRQLELTLQQLLEQKAQQVGKESHSGMLSPDSKSMRSTSSSDDASNGEERIRINRRKASKAESSDRAPQPAPRRLLHPLEQNDESESTPEEPPSGPTNAREDDSAAENDSSLRSSRRFNLQGRSE